MPDRDSDLRTFVAIDLETTGFDRLNDRIIEVGAVRFDLDGGSERFESLVAPGIPIPRAVRELTSIEDADVVGAPTATLVLAQLAAFVGTRPVVGHNVRFDLDFLANAGYVPPALALDTWELASVLLPTASRLNLGALRERLGLPEVLAHRALADADATREVFLRLLTVLDRLPRATLVDLEDFAHSAGWSATALFEDALARSGDGAREPRLETLTLPAPPAPWEPLRPAAHPEAVTPEDLEALFALAAGRADVMPGFEVRGGQLEMAQAVAGALTHGGHLAVEAGTGTGKSLAYLAPALLHAWRTGERTIVSTHTLNLQEQLASHELPLAARLVEAQAGLELGTLRWAVLKGRSNYLCLERWAEARAPSRLRTPAEARLHARVATWLPLTDTGDMGELYMPSEERAAWGDLSAGDVDCLSRRCAYVREGSCFLLRARERAAGSHVVVVNHALLLADARAGGTALPRAEHLVIDEAHRLEGVATDQFGAALSVRELRTLLDEVAAGRGATGLLRLAAAADPAPLSPAAGLAGPADAARRAGAAARDHLPAFERAARRYAEDRRESEGRSGDDLALTSGSTSQPLWEDVEEAAIHLDVALLELDRRGGEAREAVRLLPEGAAPGLDRVTLELGRQHDQLAAARGALGTTVLGPGRDIVRWLQVDDDMRLRSAPLDVSGLLAADVFEGRRSVIATSATLAAGDNFDFTLERMGLEEPDALRIASPFDYRRAVLVLVPTDVPEPDAPGHAAALHAALALAAEAAGGRTLALFTSHGAVRQAAGALRTPLARAEVTVLAQQLDGSPARLLESLAEQPRTLLLGTAAFWEGIDVRGDALSQIAVARLPFPVPTDPVYAARAEAYDDPFLDYALPQALLRFRQGFGRLIRGNDERGVFLLLDRRVLSRRYGEAFLEALPDCEVRRLPSSAIPAAVQDWLAR